MTTDDDPAEALALASDLPVILAKLKRRWREQTGTSELTASQSSALVQLEKHGPCTVTDLAQAEGVRPQSMGATITTLEAAGLVVGAPDPRDGRRTILSLSPAAVERFAVHRAVRQGWLFQAIQQCLSRDEQRELVRALALLRKLADS